MHRMNLIILSGEEAVGNRYRLTDHRAEHIRSVLRSVPGDRVEVGILNGPTGYAAVESIDDRAVVLCCDELTPVPDPQPTVDLICALPRPQTMKKVLLISAMMGVRRLHFVRANRVEKSYFQSPLIQPQNQRAYLIEGLSQGKHTRLPEVAVHDRFRPFFEDTLPSIISGETELGPPVKLLPDPESDHPLYAAGIHPDGWLLPAIGPEGGWVPFEIELMERSGFARCTLGRWTLRVETAVTAVLSQIELIRMLDDRQT